MILKQEKGAGKLKHDMYNSVFEGDITSSAWHSVCGYVTTSKIIYSGSIDTHRNIYIYILRWVLLVWLVCSI